jgi:tRNA A-37 threonylcarbamoyl transferase component Bud32
MIGPYRLERVLGTGSFATVWLARDDVLDRNVAVKILADNWSRDNEVRRRFLSEARVLLTVESPRIVRGFHLGEADTGQPYLVMACADRGTLGDRIDQRRREGRTFEPAEVVGVATEVAYALNDVHSSGHLHRDVKPTNVLIRSSSTRRNIPGLAADETIVLGDFGLARGLDLSALTLVAGSPGYVAPEQAGGLTQLDRRADLYSLGRIMLELLTGDPGGRATTMAGAASERIDVPKLIDAMQQQGRTAPPRELVDLIGRLVDEDPNHRPSSADEVAAELNAVSRAGGGTGPGRLLAPPSAPPQMVAAGPDGVKPLTGTQLSAPAPKSGRSISFTDKRVLGAGAVLVAGAAALIGAMALGGDDDPPATTVPVTQTTAPVVVPATDEPVDTAADDTGASETTAPDDTSADETAVDDTTVDDTTVDDTAGGSVPEAYGALPGQMSLPAGVYYEGAAGGDSGLDPDRQQGTTQDAPSDFAAALVAANPDWSGEVPDVAAGEPLEFELTGPDGQTATVSVEARVNTADPADQSITHFTIDY